jgi:hypothetical protein
MRTLAVVVTVAALIGVSSPAWADGGAYINLDQTYYLAGDSAVATTYVAIPKSKTGWLDRGPFYAYVLDDGSSLRAGAPIPAGALRVGTFTVKHDSGSYELETRFTMPVLSPGWHTLNVCNDPCTITGFQEPLTGSFFVVQTEREAALLIENGKLRGQLAGERRDLSKAEKALAASRKGLADQTRQAAARQTALESQLAAAETTAPPVRQGISPLLVAVAGGLLLLLVIVLAVLAARLWRYQRSERVLPGDDHHGALDHALSGSGPIGRSTDSTS